MKKYYGHKEIEQGITIDNIEVIPPITVTTLRNARQKREIKYTKISGECRYQIEWLQDYIDRNTVEVKSA